MDLAWISLAALLIVVVASCTIRLNPGVLSIVLAWVIVVWIAPAFETPGERSLGMRELVAGFPVDLFLTLVGVTLLFTQAQVNGTLDRVTFAAVKLCRGNVGLMPIMFGLLAAALASIGAGNIAAAALLSPVAMATAHRAGIPAFLMAVMVTHGAIAGAMSPVSPTGVIANSLLRERMNLVNLEWQLYAYNLAANLFVAFAGYFLFGGRKLFSRWFDGTADEAGQSTDGNNSIQRTHAVTLAVIAGLILLVVGFKTHVGMTALAGAAFLTLFRFADEGKAIQRMPWGVILMVCGVTVLTALLEKTGGADRLTDMIGHVSTPATVAAVTAFLAGVISVYSSTSGVVLPAFLPLVPRLAAEVGGSQLAIASALVVGGHLVDSSPLSTIGALCVTSAGVGEDRQVLFRLMLLWGLSMAVVGAGISWLLF
ncbi:MAG: hypothetical protein L0Y72_29775 [Gemmataceae bacterium]|nr:hypothetical protein [Gemmataceae bacterium]MCI0743237.1 hypothetical protein [Gemmataceae bacterium]